MSSRIIGTGGLRSHAASDIRVVQDGNDFCGNNSDNNNNKDGDGAAFVALK